jgi:hypothetical protein
MGKRKPIGARYEETTGSRAINISLSCCGEPYSVERDRLENGKAIIGYKIHGI